MITFKRKGAGALTISIWSEAHQGPCRQAGESNKMWETEIPESKRSPKQCAKLHKGGGATVKVNHRNKGHKGSLGDLYH